MGEDLLKIKKAYHKEKEAIGKKGEDLFFIYKSKTVKDLKHTKNKYDVVDFYSKEKTTCYEIKNIVNNNTPVVSVGLNKLKSFYNTWYLEKGYTTLIIIYIFKKKYFFGKSYSVKTIKKILDGELYETHKGGRKVRDNIFIYDGILTERLRRDGPKKHIQLNIKFIKLLKGQREEYKKYFNNNTDYSKRDFNDFIEYPDYF